MVSGAIYCRAGNSQTKMVPFMRLNLTHVLNSRHGKSLRFAVGRFPWRALIAAFGLVTLTIPAHAYIDPGTGGMLLQLLLGGVAGVLVIGKLYWLRIKEGFQNIFGGGADSEESSDKDGETGN